VKIRWSPAATALARRYLRDQDGMNAIGVAVAALADDPYRFLGDVEARGLTDRVLVD